MNIRTLRISALSLLTAAVMALASCGSDSKKADATSAEGTKGSGFRVDGSKLIDANGNEFVMRGVNHAHCWYRGNDDAALKAISETGSNTVRLVLADGEQWQKDTPQTVKALIDKCRANKLIAVLEVHDATGKDSVESLEKARARARRSSKTESGVAGTISRPQCGQKRRAQEAKSCLTWSCSSVIVPTVERELRTGLPWRMAMAGGMPSTESTSGGGRRSRNCRA